MDNIDHLENVNLDDILCDFDELPSTSGCRSSSSSKDKRVRDEVQDFIDGQKKPNTVKMTKSNIKCLQNWLSDQTQEIRNIENIPPVELNELLSQYFVKLTKRNGENYEPSSLNSIVSSVERHLRDHYYPESVMSSAVFNKTRQVVKAKKIVSKKTGLGNKSHASERIEEEDERRLIDAQQLGWHSPQSLIFSVFYYFTKGFGLRGRQDHRNIKIGDVEVKTATDGVEFIELKERNSKMMDGSKDNHQRTTKQRIYAIPHSELCPVKLFRKFIDKRPIASLLSDSPFYLTPIPVSRLGLDEDGIWYYNRPMGHNTLGTLMKTACVNASISGKKNNHSLRKSTVSELTEAGIPATKIIKITGHKNVASLQHYDGPLKEREHRNISNILCGNSSTAVPTRETPAPQQQTTVATTTTTTSACTSSLNVQNELTSIFSNATFNGCTFSIHMNNQEH